jgi:RNA-directed DNA polymerase
LRSYAWKQWKTGKRRFKEMRKLGVGKDLAAQTAGSRKGGWHNSRSPALSFALPGKVLAELGVPSLLKQPIMKV